MTAEYDDSGRCPQHSQAIVSFLLRMCIVSFMVITKCEPGLNCLPRDIQTRCHGILFLFFALFSCIVCFVSDNYLALMYCHIQS